MTLIEAQRRYIDRVNEAHPGHRRRVSRAACNQLYSWAVANGHTAVEARAICRDARDIANLELNAED